MMLRVSEFIKALFIKGWNWVVHYFTAAENKLPPLKEMSEKDSNQVVTSLMVHELVRERRSERNWQIFRRAATTLGVLLGLSYYVNFYISSQGITWNSSSGQFLGVVRVEGNIMQTSLASSEKIVPALKAAFEDPNVKAVVLAIDSGGGAPLESERITYVIESMKKKTGKPVYAVIQNLGASAAYMIAMHSDEILCGRYSLVGSIGAVMSSWDVHKALNNYDVKQEVFASGKLKAMLNPFIEPTPEAKVKAQELVNKAGKIFLTEMKASRKDKLKPGIDYATGEIWDGEQAVEIGLVDRLGTIEQLATEQNAEIKEFGPGAKTLTPFSMSTTDKLSSWAVGVLQAAFTGALHAETQPGLR